MSEDMKNNPNEITFDRTNLYREDQITDLKVGSIQRMIPVTENGEDDPSRPILYTGHAQLMSQMGPLPVSAPIEASSLTEAIDLYPQAIQSGIDRLMEEIQRRQQEEASRIVTPGGRQGGDPSGLII